MLPQAVRDWAQSRLGALDFYPLQGGASSAVYRVENASGQAAILRWHHDTEWIQREPDLIQHEAAALQYATTFALASPGLIDCSVEHHALLMSFLPGKIRLPTRFSERDLQFLAETLALIHYQQAPFDWHYHSWVTAPLSQPNWSTQTALWEAAFACYAQGPPVYSPVWIHRDFHPLNVLWTNEYTVGGVVDWVNAALGPAGIDVAHCRLNLALLYGPEAADCFLRAYQKAAPQFVYHPYWELDVVFSTFWPQPSFYLPWLHYGHNLLSDDQMQTRLSCHVTAIVSAY